MSYETHVSDEPLIVIRACEADAQPGLCTNRFRRLFNEIDTKDAEIARLRCEKKALAKWLRILIETYGGTDPARDSPNLKSARAALRSATETKDGPIPEAAALALGSGEAGGAAHLTASPRINVSEYTEIGRLHVSGTKEEWQAALRATETKGEPT